MKEIADYAQYLARMAGKLLADKLTRHNPVYYKGAIDLVTEARQNVGRADMRGNQPPLS